MPDTNIHTRKPLLPASAIALLACVGLAACGGSSSTTTSTTNASANTAKTYTAPGRPPGRVPGPGGHAARRRFGSPAFRTALAAFAACMRSNGVNLPAPNTSGTGPVFSTKGLNTASASFKAASAKCQSVLRAAFPRPPAGAGPSGAQ